MAKAIIFLLTFGFWFLSAKAQVDEQTKFKMFCSALDNLSTEPNYIVISVKNKNLGETKEICTEAPFIGGAMARENGNSSINCKNYKNRYFEFSKESALLNINFDLYTEAELDTFAKSINVIEIIQQVKNGKLTTKTFNGNRKEQIMFAHLMFNNGVMMTRGCIAGNICGLTYFKPKKP
ncbi:hypothetical protein [Flavobacterium sp. A45]|uniref:hypothetical protein n=1 Tax=Flavobacterium sp. A45 TaxID=1945862 RepID=UPI000986673E|nr:hypothetical protein [Flavobacterium sp. A45]OOG65201.1 hypothetical protein B0E44_15760 [Flavobacterium sp. A45]